MKNDILQVQEQLVTQSLDNSNSTVLKERETEYSFILNYFTTNLGNLTGNSLYICGSPGTGKTATVHSVIKELKQNKKYKKLCHFNIVVINAMALNSPQSIYSVLYQRIKGNKGLISATNACPKLEALFTVSKRSNSYGGMYIVIIDEMDGLLGNYQAVLYQLFEWCKRKNSLLILLGISNSVDLTQRFLPKLNRRNIEPKILIFKPYNCDELVSIITNRLLSITQKNPKKKKRSLKYSIEEKAFSSDNIPYFDSMAIKFCAQKVSKTSGDIRKCLEIFRKCLDYLIEYNTTKDKNNKLLLKITFNEMRKILQLYFSNSSHFINIISQLPNHQKIIVIVISLLNEASKYYIKNSLKYKNNLIKFNKFNKINKIKVKNSSNNNFNINLTLNNIFEFYKYLERKYSIVSTTYKEFYIIIDELLSEGILTLNNSNNNNINKKLFNNLRNNKKINILVSFSDVKYSVQNDKTLNRFFNEKLIQSVPSKFFL